MIVQTIQDQADIEQRFLGRIAVSSYSSGGYMGDTVEYSIVDKNLTSKDGNASNEIKTTIASVLWNASANTRLVDMN